MRVGVVLSSQLELMNGCKDIRRNKEGGVRVAQMDLKFSEPIRSAL